MGGEILTIHLGQAGVQISHALWELVCVEHGITADGKMTLEASKDENNNLEEGRNYVFRDVNHEKFVPRALLVDLEPSVVDEIRTGCYRDLWHPLQLITGKEDAASNFARGYYSQSRFEMNQVIDRIRILAEQCENMTCFKLLYSANGGTGSGLTSALCERLSDEYGKKYKFATTVYPSPGYSELMVEPYNALLHSSTNLTFCDCVLLTDNEAMLNVVEDSLRLTHAGFTVPNRVIANAVTAQFLSHRYRFLGQQHMHVNELLINLIPYPRIHFPMMAFAPFFGPNCNFFEKNSPNELIHSVFDDTNQLLSVSAARRAYISCAMLFRGSITPLEAITAVTTIKADRTSRARFVDWCPTGFKIGINFAPPVQTKGPNALSLKNASLSMIAGNLSVRDVWTGIGKRFDQLYQKRAYVHWYVAEGMEEGEFSLAREVIQQLVEDYEAIAKDAEGVTYDTSQNYGTAQTSKTLARESPILNRGPLNQNDMNINQPNTLDDPNSLHTLDNNEEALSINTNQHHSSSTTNDKVQYLRVRNNDGDAIKGDWVNRRYDQLPNIYPTYKRRLRFPEPPIQPPTNEYYRGERNQNNITANNEIPTPRQLYGTNCSAAVPHCPVVEYKGNSDCHCQSRSSEIAPDSRLPMHREQEARELANEYKCDKPTDHCVKYESSKIPRYNVRPRPNTGKDETTVCQTKSTTKAYRPATPSSYQPFSEDARLMNKHRSLQLRNRSSSIQVYQRGRNIAESQIQFRQFQGACEQNNNSRTLKATSSESASANSSDSTLNEGNLSRDSEEEYLVYPVNHQGHLPFEQGNSTRSKLSQSQEAQVNGNAAGTLEFRQETESLQYCLMTHHHRRHRRKCRAELEHSNGHKNRKHHRCNHRTEQVRRTSAHNEVPSYETHGPPKNPSNYTGEQTEPYSNFMQPPPRGGDILNQGRMHLVERVQKTSEEADPFQIPLDSAIDRQRTKHGDSVISNTCRSRNTSVVVHLRQAQAQDYHYPSKPNGQLETVEYTHSLKRSLSIDPGSRRSHPGNSG
ncbi:unnamed protein product [Calicophoron daubneyi]|uniref:Uncharacterized protein n=1 Tax=Calicophoron daubneyi TaxID=300641 RepID=A0AAV2SVV9_CALDB